MGNGENTPFIDLILIRGLRIVVPSLTFPIFSLSSCSLGKEESKERRNLNVCVKPFRLKSQDKTR